MQRFTCLLLSIAVTALLTPALRAQDDQTAVHDELRQFRQELVTAVVASDIDAQIALSHPEIVTMWQDGRVASGHDGLKSFLETMGTGEERGFLGYRQEPTPLDLTSVYDDRFAFAHGTSVAQYDLYGMEFDLPNYWTATLLKDNDQWKLVGYHVSGNLADNPLLAAAKKSIAYVAAVVGVLGFIVGLVLGRLSKRGKVRSAPVTSS